MRPLQMLGHAAGCAALSYTATRGEGTVSVLAWAALGLIFVDHLVAAIASVRRGEPP